MKTTSNKGVVVNDKTPKIYLSRRNLLALLSKLDRDSEGDDTVCTIVKYKQPTPGYQQTMDAVMVIAVQDTDYYGTRSPGDMHPLDELNIKKYTE